MTTSIQNKMGVRPISKLIFEMSLPPIISMFLQYSYNFIDTAFVAQISEDALTAISFSFPLTTFMIATSIGIGVGINVLVAKYLGQNNQDKANTVTTTGILISFFVGVLMTLVIYQLLGPYFRLYITDPTIYSLTMRYMRICVLMQVPNMVHIAFQKILQGTGNMILPMIAQSVGAIFNIIMDPILIFGWAFFPALGIEGAAISTVLGYTLSMVILGIYLVKKEDKVRVKVKGYQLEWRMVKDIFVFGLPSFMLNVLGAFMTTFANVFLVAYSYTAVAFFGAYFKIQHLVVMTVNGLIQGCLPIMSFNYGAKSYDRLNKTFQYGSVAAFLIMSLGGLFVLLFPNSLLRLFQASDAMMELGKLGMRIMPWTYGVIGITTMIATYLQAVGKVNGSIFVNLLRQFLLLIPMMWLLSNLFGIIGIWLAFPITELISLVVSAFLFKKNKVQTL